MSKKKSESHILPPLQRKIILHLAKEGAQTKNEIASGVSTSYKPTWTAFNSLQKKKLIKETTLKTYRGQTYPQYWLTDDGALIALAEGADSKHLLGMAKQIYPEDQRLACYLEVLPKVNLDIIRVVYSITHKGRFELDELLNLLLIGSATEKDDQSFEETVDTFKAYPDEFNAFKKRMDHIMEGLDKLKEFINASLKT
jgi:hypothetical protein